MLSFFSNLQILDTISPRRSLVFCSADSSEWPVGKEMGARIGRLRYLLTCSRRPHRMNGSREVIIQCGGAVAECDFMNAAGIKLAAPVQLVTTSIAP